MKVFVTGGTGFIGGEVVRRLRERVLRAALEAEGKMPAAAAT